MKISTYNFLFLTFSLVQISQQSAGNSILKSFPLTLGDLHVIPETNNENVDENTIAMTIPRLIQMIGYNPNELIQATKSGNIVQLRQFRTFIREKISRMVSFSCFSDLLYFADSLLELALAQYDLSNRCIKSEIANCSCADAVDRSIVENTWALDVLDSLGKFPAGFVTGNFWMLGDFEECIQTSAPKSSPKHKWEGQYCRIDVSLYETNMFRNYSDDVNAGETCSGVFVFKLGSCFPKTCSVTDVQSIINFAFNTPQKIADKKIICGTKIICHEPLSVLNDIPALILLCFLTFILVVTFFGSIYDYFVFQETYQKLPKVIHRVNGNDNEILLQEIDPHTCLETQTQFYNRQHALIKILLSFSIYTNGKKIFDTEQKPNQIHCLHGIRVFSVFWVIWGHTYYSSWETVDNQLGMLNSMPHYIMNHMLLNASMSTDTFYLLSGTLLTYLWMKEMKKSNGKAVLSVKMWIMYYVHRYIRLTPVYAVILAIHVFLIRYAADGPIWDQNGIDNHRCANSWWTNLLYVNNFFWLKEQCMTWTWYLANDMQFYVFALPVLIILWKREKIGLVLVGLILFGTAMLRMGLVLRHDKWPPIAILMNDISLTSIIYPFWTQIYMKPYCRCGPFLVGILLGYTLYKTNLKITMPKWAGHIGWILASILGLGILFGLYDFSRTTKISLPGKIVYSAFGRTLWSVAVSWVVLACSTGYGGPVNKFLSWTIWIPLSRLVYCAYLLHPIFINVFYMSQMRPVHYSGHFIYTVYFLANILFAFTSALIFSLMFEVPILGIEKVIFGSTATKDEKKPKKEQRNERT